MSEGSRETSATTHKIKEPNANPTNSVKLGTAETFYSATCHCWSFTCRCVELNHFICTRRGAEGQGRGGGGDEFLIRGEHSGRKVLTTFQDANISPTSPICPPIASRCKTIYDNNVPGHIRGLLSPESAHF